ncbi:hypothetical protein NKG05_14450 [Oerskovia sp. M15]
MAQPALLGLGLVLVAGGEAARRAAARGARVSTSWARDAATYLSLAAVLAAVGGLAAALQVVADPGMSDPSPTRVFLGALAWSAAGPRSRRSPGTGWCRPLPRRAGAGHRARRRRSRPARTLGPPVVGRARDGARRRRARGRGRPELDRHHPDLAARGRAPGARRPHGPAGPARDRARGPALAAAWFVWALALVTAIGAWSPRELRVEVFRCRSARACSSRATWRSWRRRDGCRGAFGSPTATARPTRPALTARFADWPVGFVGSWRTLAVGIVATLGPSVLATYTDARTWRAMLVVGLALAAVLVGTRYHLAAPFVLGSWCSRSRSSWCS